MGCETCVLCGEGLAAGFSVPEFAERLCGLCRRARPVFARAVAYGSYEGALRGLIHLLKYDGVQPAAGALGKRLAAAMAALMPVFEDETVAVVPVPLHREKLRQRGFNQAELAARAALKLVGGGFALEADVLKRERPTESQIGLTRHQRRANLRGAFAVSRPELIAGRPVLLVDDVLTTGTTASECARVLRRAGASKVWVATVARTLKTSVSGQDQSVVRMAAAA
ncbi:MAG TPA: ComF family protein [Terriglobales bacterium]|nr:ComF family protein [Terriglobales bacterium]